MENRKHAYLVMAHNEPELLCKLLGCLDDERNDIYLHLDQKFDAISENDLKDQCKSSNVFLSKENRFIGLAIVK